SAPRQKAGAGGCHSHQKFAAGSIYQSHCYSLLGFRTISKTYPRNGGNIGNGLSFFYYESPQIPSFDRIRGRRIGDVKKARSPRSRNPITAEIRKRHNEAVQRLQQWIRQPSIAAENRGVNEGCEL